MPTRRHLLLVPLIVAALGAALVSGIPSAPTVAARATPGVAAPVPPNVFFYNLDDLRDAVSGGVDPLAYMPKLTGWMASGTRYRKSFVIDPACCPPRASMMTGRNTRTTTV